MLVIVYGIAGAGKTYLGKLLQNKFGFYFWDADNALPDKMIDHIKHQKPFDQEMRDEYIEILKKRITLLQETVRDKPIVVSQALYKSNARKALMQTFPDAKFIHVTAKDEMILERLKKRNNNLDDSYLIKIRPYFEFPAVDELEKTIIIENNFADDSGLVKSLEEFLNIKKLQDRQVVGRELPKVNIVIDEVLPAEMKKEFSSFCEDVMTNVVDSEKPSDIFKIQIEQESDQKEEKKILSWVEDNIEKQDFDLKIQIQSSHKEAVIYFQSNKVKFVSFGEKEELIQYLVALIKKNLIYVQERNSKVISFREKANYVDEYYKKYFQYNAVANVSIDSSLHLIKTFNENRRFLQVNTFIPGKLYKHRDSTVPTIIYFPGTVYTRLLKKTIDNESYKLAAYTGCNVFTIHYRLSPENLYPAALHDAMLAYEYLIKISEEVGIDPSKIILSGYSSGASIALQLAKLAGTSGYVKPLSLVLMSPILDFEDSQNTAEKERFVSAELIQSMSAVYLSEIKDLKSPIISPLYMKEEDLRVLPKIFIFQLEHDYLVKQHEKFCKKLEDISIEAEVIRIPGLDHCSWWDNQLPWEFIADWMRKTYGLEDKKVIFNIEEAKKIIFEDRLLNFKVTGDLPLSFSSEEEKINIDEAYQDLFLKRKRASQIVEKAKKYPNCISLQIYSIFYYFLFQNKLKMIEIDECFAHLQRLKGEATEYEINLINAIQCSKEEKLEKAVELYTKTLTSWPSDILSGMVAEWHNFQKDDSEKNIEIWSKVQEFYDSNHHVSDHPLTSYVFAKIAQALFNVGESEKAICFAGQALAMNPFNHYAQRALALISSEVVGIDTGIFLLEKYQPTWAFYDDSIKVENTAMLVKFQMGEGNCRNDFDMKKLGIKGEEVLLMSKNTSSLKRNAFQDKKKEHDEKYISSRF